MFGNARHSTRTGLSGSVEGLPASGPERITRHFSEKGRLWCSCRSQDCTIDRRAHRARGRRGRSKRYSGGERGRSDSAARSQQLRRCRGCAGSATKRALQGGSSTRNTEALASRASSVRGAGSCRSALIAR
jgi:hypothetical protein